MRNLTKTSPSECRPIRVGAPGRQARAIEGAIRRLLAASGADLNDPNLAETPRRAAEAYAYELLCGYRTNISEVFKTFEEPSDEAVLVRQIPFYSLCAHHVLPFFGTASVVYKPSGKVVGLSKIGRLVDCYARRLQIQERLTRQVADAIQVHLGPSATIVVMRAEHMCMSMRGIKHSGSETVTCAVRGASQSAILECRRLMEMVLGESTGDEHGSAYVATNHA
jgi:GTP cyclohydrolase IA